MEDYRITSAIIGLGITGLILYLVRRDWVHSRHAIWWILIASAIALLSLYPQWVDAIGALLGIGYPPVIPLILGLCLMIVKLLAMDIQYSKLERTVLRLAQRVAILEAELERAERNDKP